jgi:hypothetical protein
MFAAVLGLKGIVSKSLTRRAEMAPVPTPLVFVVLGI